MYTIRANDKDDGGESLFKMDDPNLLFSPAKSDKIMSNLDQGTEESSLKDLINAQGARSGNCFAISGNFTQRGKPYLACDPHTTKA